jgi:hypothetical protein
VGRPSGMDAPAFDLAGRRSHHRDVVGAPARRSPSGTDAIRTLLRRARSLSGRSGPYLRMVHSESGSRRDDDSGIRGRVSCRCDQADQPLLLDGGRRRARGALGRSRLDDRSPGQSPLDHQCMARGASSGPICRSAHRRDLGMRSARPHPPPASSRTRQGRCAKHSQARLRK